MYFTKKEKIYLCGFISLKVDMWQAVDRDLPINTWVGFQKVRYDHMISDLKYQLDAGKVTLFVFGDSAIICRPHITFNSTTLHLINFRDQFAQCVLNIYQKYECLSNSLSCQAEVLGNLRAIPSQYHVSIASTVLRAFHCLLDTQKCQFYFCPLSIILGRPCAVIFAGSAILDTHA